jgi:uncharacterized protein (UPF0276 family)
MNTFPNLGIGLGLRTAHYSEIFTSKAQIDFLEIISENFMDVGGKVMENLERILDLYPVVQHGVSLSIGSTDPLNFEYLKELKKLTKKTKTPWFSDHLCWSSHAHTYLHDLLPLPYTQATINHIVERAKIVQDYIELPFALENLSSYVTFASSEMTEWDFYSEIVEKANCYMMLDVNNIYVSSRNHHFDPNDYLKNLPYDRVIQMHIAGHTDKGTIVLDTHNDFVRAEVWKIYQKVCEKKANISTILEWDDDFISFANTHAEALKAKIYQKGLVK